MSKKFTKLEAEEQEEISSLLDIISENSLELKQNNVRKICGVCYDCEYFRLVETEFEILYTGCSELERRLDPAKPITYCSMYRQRGQPSLWDMKQIATIIEIPKQKTGFLK